MVTLATSRSTIYTAVYNLLQTGTYELSTDNIHPYVSDGIWVGNEKEYPIIELRIDVATIPRNRFGSVHKTASGGIVITVFHNSSANLKTISDEIVETFTTEGALQVLAAAGIKVKDIERDEQEPQGYAPKRTMHSEVITIDFIWRS